MKIISILGSTGSIGISTLSVISLHPERFKVFALGGFNNVDFEEIGIMISNILDSLLLSEDERKNTLMKTKKQILDMCSKYPIYLEAF